ncbi:MAG: enoyl-CoA hydratase-related protein [Bdellovibrionota bacterium]
MASTIKTSLNQGVFTVELARPEVRNAFNEHLVADLQGAFDKIARDEEIRVVVFKGQGSVFCAGGDLNWMRSAVNMPADENLADTRKLARMFATLNECPKPVVGLVQGAAIGGGVGLVSICDYVIASRETQFSLSEVRLGIIPACIGPFVLAKIGETHARAYFMSAERFSAERAHQIGLVHEVVENPAALEASCGRITANLLQCGPKAMAAAKALVRGIKSRNFEDGLEYVAKTLAELRVSPEGLEGVTAFLEKRKPNWIKE